MAAILAIPGIAAANGKDLPPEILLQGFAKPEQGHFHLLVRVPLVLLASFSLPKRGPGYLDLAHIDDRLQQAADSTGRQIALREDGAPLQPISAKGRISLLSDRSFLSYADALAHIEGPSLPQDTDLFWNQGFFDVHLEYAVRSPQGHFSVAVNVAPELGQRVKLQLELLRADAPALHYRLPGYSGWIPLDPTAVEAAWLFVRVGFIDAFAFDRLVFLVCLIAPFRQFRSLLAVVLVLAGLQTLTCTAVAQGWLPDTPLLPVFSGTALAGAIVALGVGNLAGPGLRARWFLSALAGACCGFDLGHTLTDVLQFAGGRPLVSVAAFDIGMVAAEVVSLAVLFAALRLLFARVLQPEPAVVILSALLGHMAWHWMTDQGDELAHQIGHVGLSSAALTLAPWLLAALLIGCLAALLPRGFGGAPVPSLLPALLARRNRDIVAR